MMLTVAIGIKGDGLYRKLKASLTIGRKAIKCLRSEAEEDVVDRESNFPVENDRK